MMKPGLFRWLFFFAALAMCAATASAQVMGHWVTDKKFAPLPEPSEEYWSATANGKFYLIGGTAIGGGAHPIALPGRVLEYDPAADKWTSRKPMPHPADHMAVAEYNGKVYVFGGAGAVKPGEFAVGSVQLDDAWEYTPATDSWKALAPMPTRRNAAAAVTVGGKIYVMGGTGLLPGAPNPSPVGQLIVLGTNEVYDPATDKWETKRPAPTPRNHPAIGAVGGKIYLIGGRAGHNNVANMISSPSDVVEEYDPATDRWNAMSKMPTARSGHGWATYQGRIYVAGGEIRDYHLDAVFRDFEVFDPALNQWFRLPPMTIARHGVNVAVLGNRIHVIGGHLAFDGAGEHEMDTGVQEVWEITGK
jgi:N-acetylneuraminic acid mutarotase